MSYKSKGVIAQDPPAIFNLPHVPSVLKMDHTSKKTLKPILKLTGNFENPASARHSKFQALKQLSARSNLIPSNRKEPLTERNTVRKLTKDFPEKRSLLKNAGLGISSNLKNSNLTPKDLGLDKYAKNSNCYSPTPMINENEKGAKVTFTFELEAQQTKSKKELNLQLLNQEIEEFEHRLKLLNSQKSAPTLPERYKITTQP